MHRLTSRRDFLTAACVGAASYVLLPRLAVAEGSSFPSSSDHPTPRPGITSDAVLKKEQLADTPDAIPAFDMVREIPQIIDGIRCNCGCAGEKGYYSLLSCYEAPAMAKHCMICQGQGRLAYRLNKAGKTLDEIRKGIDARYG